MATESTSFYSEDELSRLGLLHYGENVKISRKCSIYSPSKISIGDNVRIDDFCILSGTIIIGSHIHISAYCALYGKKRIVIEDFSGLSPRATIFSAMDNFNGDYLIGPIHDTKFTDIIEKDVIINKYCQIGAESIVFPGVIIEEGVAVGAMSMVNKSLKKWGVYAGIPCRRIKERSKGLLRFINLSNNTIKE